jgi:hypothetical protein
VSDFNFTPAQRRAVRLLISLSSVSGGGKTYSALLLAAGLAGPGGKVGMIDTESERGTMYADSPGIMKALPGGYLISQMNPPFAPQRYVAAITAAENAGVDVLVIDSTSHEWEGVGGCCDIAEATKLGGMDNWAKAKTEHKKFLYRCLLSSMHIVFCLRARDKVKILKGVPAKDMVVPLGIQPIAEKGFVFEMTLAFNLDEITHFAVPAKVPEPLVPLFPKEHLLTVADGERIREWNETAPPPVAAEQILKRARLAAEQGMAVYKSFYDALSKPQQLVLKGAAHAENKAVAAVADKADGPPAGLENLAEFPDQPVDEWYRVDGKFYRMNEEAGNYREWNPKEENAGTKD